MIVPLNDDKTVPLRGTMVDNNGAGGSGSRPKIVTVRLTRVFGTSIGDD